VNKPDTTRAALRAALWAAAALAWGGILAAWRGTEPAAQYFAGYLVELGLSVDNVFVFFLIFERFRTPPREQSRILFWGVLGAIAMRGIFIVAGVGLLRRFPPVLWIFGAFLAYTGFRLLRSRGRGDVLADPSEGRIFRWSRRLGLPVFATILILVETTDLVFALDSLPAVLAVTKSLLVALTSNLFAVFGLRSLYLVVNGMVPRFRHLKTGLAVILLFIGAKMLAEPWVQVSTPLTLGVIGAVLAACLLL
jgi:tellurite resistance protein TerC